MQVDHEGVNFGGVARDCTPRCSSENATAQSDHVHGIGAIVFVLQSRAGVHVSAEFGIDDFAGEKKINPWEGQGLKAAMQDCAEAAFCRIPSIFV